MSKPTLSVRTAFDCVVRCAGTLHACALGSSLEVLASEIVGDVSLELVAIDEIGCAEFALDLLTITTAKLARGGIVARDAEAAASREGGGEDEGAGDGGGLGDEMSVPMLQDF